MRPRGWRILFPRPLAGPGLQSEVGGQSWPPNFLPGLLHLRGRGGLKTPCLFPTGDGLDSEEQDEEAPRPKLSVPEELESREALVSGPPCSSPVSRPDLHPTPPPVVPLRHSSLQFSPSSFSGHPPTSPGSHGQPPCHPPTAGMLPKTPRRGVSLCLPTHPSLVLHACHKSTCTLSPTGGIFPLGLGQR